MSLIYVTLSVRRQSMTALMTSQPTTLFCSKLGRLHIYTAHRRYFVAYDPHLTDPSEIEAFFKGMFDVKTIKTHPPVSTHLDGKPFSSRKVDERLASEDAPAREVVRKVRLWALLCRHLRGWFGLRNPPDGSDSQ